MGTKLRRIALAMMGIGLAALLSGCAEQIVVLNPKGEIGKHQADLIWISTALCLVIIVPVLILTFVIVWRYRHKPGSKAKYTPEWEHSTKLETIWWGIPILVIAVLGAITIKYTYMLEPSKALKHEEKPIVIQVTSLDWKWLFQYPEQGIATVNYVQFPADVPVKFELTSDAPMNSFWIPQLGGQIYTMSGMKMTLNLIADEPGDYLGSGANFSGKDFAKMQFTARAMATKAEFEDWVSDVKKSNPPLTVDGYTQLALPGVSERSAYSAIPAGLFDKIVNKYGGHQHGEGGSSEGGEQSEHSGHSDQAESGGHDSSGHEGMDMDMDMDMSASSETNHQH